jgi:hypothetical protein
VRASRQRRRAREALRAMRAGGSDMVGSDEKPRSWGEKHGGAIYIGGAFLLIALLVIVRTACN